LALLNGSISYITSIYSQYEIVAARDAETARREVVREGMGKFIEEGQNLPNKCADATIPLPTSAVVDWDTRAKEPF
jgi:hypothetical protein